MTLSELVAHLRDHILRDKAKPPLWSSAELTSYLNEAQDQFARRTHCLADDTSDFTFVETEAGEPLYQLDPRVVFVAEVLHDGRPLLDRARRQLSRGLAESRPVAYTMDAAMRTMRLTPTPDGVYTLDLLVARKPLAPLVEAEDTPEIDEDYHLALCDWAAYRALRNNDPDGGNTLAADGFKVDWEMRVRDAKRAVYRMRAGATPAARRNATGKVR